jgi:hypothetical protein
MRGATPRHFKTSASAKRPASNLPCLCSSLRGAHWWCAQPHGLTMFWRSSVAAIGGRGRHDTKEISVVQLMGVAPVVPLRGWSLPSGVCYTSTSPAARGLLRRGSAVTGERRSSVCFWFEGPGAKACRFVEIPARAVEMTAPGTSGGALLEMPRVQGPDPGSFAVCRAGSTCGAKTALENGRRAGTIGCKNRSSLA